MKEQKSFGESTGKTENLLEKQQQWETKMKALKVPDMYGYVIDEGIIETVAVLQLLGFNTTQSDQGNYSNSPWIQFEAEEPKDIYIGEDALKIEFMKNMGILPEEIDEKSPVFSRSKQVDVEGDARQKLQTQSASYTPEYEKWRTDTLRMVENLQIFIDEFYDTEPIPESSKDLKVEIVFTYRSPEYAPYIQDVPSLRINFISSESKFSSEEERQNMVSRTRIEMERFTRFLKDKFYSDKK